MPSSRTRSAYEMLCSRGATRGSFLNYCAVTATMLGLGSLGYMDIVHAMEAKPRTPVLWINGLSCSCCTESFIRSAHPLASDIVLDMIAFDFQDTLMAASAKQANAALHEGIKRYKGEYILAVEGNVPLGADGMFCFEAGKPFHHTLMAAAKHAKAVVAWGNCASWGCVQATHPNPNMAKPVKDFIHDKPLVNIPGCPPLPEVMNAVVAYILTYNRIPPLDAQGRPTCFYGTRVRDVCVRRTHFDTGQLAESWGTAAAQGWLVYTKNCKGSATYNACPATRLSNGVLCPIQYGHGCLGCAKRGFWDRRSLDDRVPTILQRNTLSQLGTIFQQSSTPQRGTNTTANTVGGALHTGLDVGVALHAAVSAAVHLKRRIEQDAKAGKAPLLPPDNDA